MAKFGDYDTASELDGSELLLLKQGSSTVNLAAGYLGRLIGQVSATRFGKLLEGSSSHIINVNTATMAAIKAYVDDVGGSVHVHFPPGGFSVSAASAIEQPYTVYVGHGTTILPTMDACPLPVGYNADTARVVSSGVVGFEFAYAGSVASSAGYALEFRGGSRCFYQGIRHFSFAHFCKYGAATLPLNQPAIGLVRDCQGGVLYNGVVTISGSSLTIDGHTIIGGVSGNSGRGFDIGSSDSGAHDGLYVMPGVTFSDFDRAVYIHPTSGSAASLEFYNSFTNFKTYGIDIALSGTGTLHHLMLNGTRFFGTSGTGSEDLLHYTNTGTGEFLEFMMWNVEAEEISERLIYCDASGGSTPIIKRWNVANVKAYALGAKTNNTYDAIDFGSVAHPSVMMSNLTLLGGATNKPRYGLVNGNAITHAAITGVDASDAGTGVYNNMYTPGNNLKLTNLIGTAL
jgi:hypothetical protein